MVKNKESGSTNYRIEWTGLLLGIAAALLVFLLIDFGEGNAKELTAAIAVLMSIWWIFEAVPLAATALIPLVAFPLLGLVGGKATASSYFNSTIFLFFGGFVIAIAMEEWNLHKRIALRLISLFGSSAERMILGFMAAAAFLSMWISNTATAVMLLPIGMAVLGKMEAQYGLEKTKSMSVALMLGIAYACSIGGVGTLIGTPPNLVFRKIYAMNFPDSPEILFGEWMIAAIPFVLILLFITWLLLAKVVSPPQQGLRVDKGVIKDEIKKLGKFSYEEKAVAFVFAITAFLWIFRGGFNLEIVQVPGWSELFPVPEFIDDGTIAVGMALLLFFIPNKQRRAKQRALLDVSVFRKIPWEIILLFGGGFALAGGFVETGLSDHIGKQFVILKDLPVIVLIGGISLVITFLTELTSNTATSQIILPILASMALELQIEPLILMLPATISASMAFMMPVATPPNAIIFGSGKLRVYQMAKAGIILNFIAIFSITLFVYFLFG